MLEVFALILYSVQWLGVAVCVGAETVLLSAHLIARHERQPAWLEHMPGVRGVQGAGLLLIIASGAGAVWYHLLANQIEVLLVPTFGFKWLLIGLVGLTYLWQRRHAGHAVLEGFAGATWYALFLVHSVAPVAAWADLFVFYAGWLVVFGIGWSAFVLLMRLGKSHAARTAEPVPPVRAAARAEVRPVAHKPSKLTPKKTTPPPLAAPVAVVAAEARTTPRISWLQRIASVFVRPRHEPARAEPQPQPQPQPVVARSIPSHAPAPLIPSAPVRLSTNRSVPPAPPGTLAVEYLELEAPQAPAVAAVIKPAEEYDDLPAIQVMPRSPEDAQKASLKFRAV
jgi:hypothetical protein